MTKTPTLIGHTQRQADVLLEIENLHVHIAGERYANYVLNDLSLQIEENTSVGLVGESGSGKSMSALAIMGLLPQGAKLSSGKILFQQKEISAYTEEQYRQEIRGRRISLIFQDALASLNPLFTIGEQMREAVAIRHPNWKNPMVLEKCMEWLTLVQLPYPAQRMKEYPHQLSGGMRQRVMIAMALASEPDLLIADEPTTALDVTIQAQIIDLLQSIQEQLGMAILLITHDMGVISEVCEKVYVMYGGQVVESGHASEFFTSCEHPYTQGLLNSIPQGKRKNQPLESIAGVVEPFYETPRHCLFASRCAWKENLCTQQIPELIPHHQSLQTRCIRSISRR